MKRLTFLFFMIAMFATVSSCDRARLCETNHFGDIKITNAESVTVDVILDSNSLGQLKAGEVLTIEHASGEFSLRAFPSGNQVFEYNQKAIITDCEESSYEIRF